MRMGTYPGMRAHMSADGVQRGDSTDDFKLELVEQLADHVVTDISNYAVYHVWERSVRERGVRQRAAELDARSTTG